MIITIDTDDLPKLVAKGSKFVFDAEAEKSLVELIQLQDAIESAVKEVKEAIAEAGKELTPDFTGVQSDLMRANYSFHGALYGVEEDKVASEFVVKKVSYTANKDVVEKFAEIHGALPVGIFKHDRTKSMTLTVKKPKAIKE